MDAIGQKMTQTGGPDTAAPRREPVYPFPFLRSFDRRDQAIFFGREQDIDALVSRIQYERTLVVNGLSGSGKSSLLKAGAVPRLEALGYDVIYVQVLQDITDDILAGLRREIATEDMANDFVEALEAMVKAWDPHPGLVLVVDQFERSLSHDHKPESLQAFFRGLARLAGRVEQVVTVVLVVRADWLYYLESQVHRHYPDLNVHSCVFTVDPLTPGQAKQAIIRPLQARDFPYDEEVVDDIINGLRGTIAGLPTTEFVHPLQLQMVLHALFQRAERRGAAKEAFTSENYRSVGTTQDILRAYIKNTVEPHQGAWRALARFLGPDRKTPRTLRRSEAQSVPDTAEIEPELDFLIKQGLIVTYTGERPGDSILQLSHDYLVGVIVDYLNDNQDKAAWWVAEGWLATGTLEWQAARDKGDKEPVLLERGRYLRIYEHLKGQKVSDPAQKLLTLTALSLGEAGLGHWLLAGADQDGCRTEVIDALLAESPMVRSKARQALCQGFAPDFVSSTPQAGIAAEALAHELRIALGKPNRQRQDAAAQALWALGRFESRGQRLAVGARVSSHWLRMHAVQVASYGATALLVLAVVLGALYARERLRGSWQSIYSLKAGSVPIVVSDPGTTDTLYAVAVGGPGPREGNSLFVQRNGEWTMLSRDFGRGWPTAMVVARQGPTRAYLVSLYGGGVLRSIDEGQSWQVANQGLPSHGIIGMVVDPAEPAVVYAATFDWRGVLRSTNAGESWDFYDYGGEIYGVAITGMAYSAAEGGILIAGTEDGRILVHRHDTTEWELRSSLSKGSITALAALDDGHVYAGTSRGIVMLSHDGGLNWSVLGQIPDEFNIGVLASASGAPGPLYARAYGNGGQKLWMSTDGGNDWQMLRANGLPRNGISALKVSMQASNRLVAGGTDGLFTSTDGGVNWDKVPLAAPLASPRIVAVSSQHASPVYTALGGSVYVNDGSIYTDSETEAARWTLGKGLNAEFIRSIVVDPDNAQLAYAGVLLLGEWSVFVTHDGGHTWQQTTPPHIEPVVPDTLALAIGKDRNGAKVVYAGTIGCGVFRTTDEGKNWDSLGRTRCSETTSMPSDVGLLAVDQSDAEKVYAATGQAVHASTDGGLTWRASMPDVDGPILGLVTDSMRPDTLYLVAGSSGFWRSQDSGVTWTRLGERTFGEADVSTIAAVPGATGQIVVGSANGGVWTSRNGGETWQFIRENLTVSAVTTIALSKELGSRILISSSEDGMAMFNTGQLFGAKR
jgi:photosystem II stability/assembly factor-like uncharacterized protein